MLQKVYKSNICSLWDLQKQNKIIDEKVNEFGFPYCDELDKKEKRKHKKLMPERDMMLRKSQRKVIECINVASFAVLASDAEDFLVVLACAAERGSWLRDLSAGVTVKSHKDWRIATKLFEQGRRRNSEFEIGRLGGLKSAEVRGKKCDIAAEACRVEWPFYNYTSAELAAQHGVSVGSLKKRLGARKEIRAIAKMSQRSKAKKEFNKCLKLK